MPAGTEPLLSTEATTAEASSAPLGHKRLRRARLLGSFCVVGLVAGSGLAYVGRGNVQNISDSSLSLDEETCSHASVGSCLFLPCISGRNADCVNFKCVCRPGFCAVTKGALSGGFCELPRGTLEAKVAKVDSEYPSFPSPHNDIKTAVCLSGGGARAASLTIGALRALEDLGLMSRVDAISSISGSLFSSIPYMFADTEMYQKRDTLESPDEPLWGFSTTPSELTLQKLDYHTSPMGTQFADGWGGAWGTVKEFSGTFLPHVATDRHHVEAEWRNLMTEQFLEPFGLGNKDCFMAKDDAAEARIRAANPQLADLCFYKPRPGKPKVYVIGAAILSPAGSTKVDAASFQISPDWSGSPFHINVSTRPHYSSTKDEQGLNDDVIGGGLVETFAFGGMEPDNQDAGLQDVPLPRRPFTLADAMAIATYADFLPGKKVVDWTPSYEYWPVGKGKEPARRMMIGDGGFIEDTGLLPMLQRQAARIALFLFGGPGQQISNDVEYCDLKDQIAAGTYDPATFVPANKLGDSIYTIFGYGYDDGMWHKSHNAVFKQEEMFSVACELQKLKKDGKPQVYATTQYVQKNEYWGIRPYKVEMIYVYNDHIPEFEAQLPQETQDSLQKDMKGFPTDLAAGLYMKPRIIKLMAAQSEYMVKQNADKFKHLFRRSFWFR